MRAAQGTNLPQDVATYAIAAGVSARLMGDVGCRTRRLETGDPPKTDGRAGPRVVHILEGPASPCKGGASWWK